MKKLITSCLVITAITGTSLANFGGGYALETFTPNRWIWFFWLCLCPFTY